MISLTLVDIPSQKAAMSSSFTPILGQYGVGIREFCNLFNISTKNIMEEIPINITIKALSRDKMMINFLRVSPNFLINFMLKSNKTKSLDLKTIYMLFCIDLKFNMNPRINLKSQFKTKIAYIKSFGIKILD